MIFFNEEQLNQKTNYQRIKNLELNNNFNENQTKNLNLLIQQEMKKN